MISLRQVKISYKGRKALSYPDLDINDNEFIFFVGGNGRGKSTLVYYLAGIIPSLITAKVSGRANGITGACLVLQNPSAQFLAITVREELGDFNERLFDVKNIISKSVFELSEGEKQKVNLISRIMTRKNLLILDEPLELLDAAEAKKFIGVLQKIKGSRTIVWVDKDTRFSALADRVIFLDQTDKKKGRADAVMPTRHAGAARVSRALKAPRIRSGNSALASLRPDKERCRKNIVMRITGLSHNAGGFDGFSLKKINLFLRKGEKVAVIGSNGSGKTTLLKFIANPPRRSGRFFLETGVRVSYAPQNPSHLLFGDDVISEIALGFKNFGRTHGLKDAIDTFGLAPFLKKDPSQLSKGQQKLVSVAASLFGDLVMLDEPTTWLDRENSERVYRLIANSDKTMLIATHDRDIIPYCHRVLIMSKGDIKECSSTTADRFLQGLTAE